MTFGYEFLIIFVMLVCNAIFAAYEMALASITHARIMVLVNEKRRGANEAAYMKEHIGASLTVIQLGITLVGAFAAATGGLGVGDALGPRLAEAFGMSGRLAEVLSLIFFIIPLSFVTIIFAELVPKMFALSNREWVILRFSPFMKLLALITHPVIRSIEGFVKRVVAFWTNRWTKTEGADKKRMLAELIAAVSLARTSRLFGDWEEKIVLSAAHLSMRPVKEIIIPASDMFTLYMGDTLTNAFLKAHLDMHTRFPVCASEDDPQTIEGYVNFKDIMVAMKISPADSTVRGIMRPIMKMDENMPISQLLEKMIQEKSHITVITSPNGRVLGMVTMEDILEELVGEIEDEFDRLPSYAHPYGEAWIFGGGVPVTTVATTVGLNWSKKFEGQRPPSLAEWCAKKAGGPPKWGEVIEAEGLKVIPRKFRRRKLAEAAVSAAESSGS